MRDIRFIPDGFSEYLEWSIENKGVYNRLHKLINEVARTLFEGTGKPEPLKHELKGYWSRRITDEHRLVYAVERDHIVIVACKNHYKR